MITRQGNNPKRRITLRDHLDDEELRRISSCAKYSGSPHHKRIPVNYGFPKRTAPRPGKSLCDASRTVSPSKAARLFRDAISRGMISTYRVNRLAKYVWAAADDDRAHQAKLEKGASSYHGYELGDNEASLRAIVLEDWTHRCPMI